jgi:molybdopterin-guanine dinucleotide biosynthesis protein A
MTEQTKITTVTAVVLAGGRASRMGGQDKGLIPLADRPMVAYAVEALLPQVGELIINANRNLDAYRGLGHDVVSDGLGEFFGPLAGLLAALEAVDTPFVVTAPCDSPLLPSTYVARMHAAVERNNADLSVAHDGRRLQPVFALVRTTLMESLRNYLLSGERKIDRWFARHDAALADFSDRPSMFRNINTREELTALEVEITKPHR